MLFNSLEFFIFLPIVFILYWFVFGKSLKFQNLLLLISSYIFYGWWDWRFLFLILTSSILDYLTGIKIIEDTKNKKKWLTLSLIFNLGLLGVFKYYNFFIESWVDLFNSVGYNIDNRWTLNIILPVGISFYTFQTMSYSIDVYKGVLKPTKNFISFAAFVSFFPQLVAGPIERASSLLPQISNKRSFNSKSMLVGIELIIWGFFKKVVIADSLAPIVNDIFSDHTIYSGGTLIIGAIFFAFQIYGDFSGYSDIAIGVSKLFGINLMTNFNFPYFSKSISEFWRKWHISLSTWFRDYLYIPLGGSKVKKHKAIRNVFIIFLVSGFWHGANWTFMAWGGIHALLFLPSFVLGTNRNHLNASNNVNLISYTKDFFKVLYTFIVVTLAWIFFRANTITNAFDYIYNINSFKLDEHSLIMKSDITLVIIFVLFDYLRFKKIKFPFILWLLISIIILGALNKEVQSGFIYFQF